MIFNDQTGHETASRQSWGYSLYILTTILREDILTYMPGVCGLDTRETGPAQY